MKNKILFILIFLLAVFIRLYGFTYEELWYDEYYSIDIAEKNIDQIIQIIGHETVPPLHYFLLHIWLKIKPDFITENNLLLWVRLYPFIWSMLTLLLVYKFAIYFFDRSTALIASLFVAVSPFHLLYTHEIRLYTEVCFFTLLSSYYFLKSIKTDNKIDWIFYFISTTCAVYIHFLSFFVCAAHFLYFLFYVNISQKQNIINIIKKFILSNVLIGLTFLPWIIYFLHRRSHMNNIAWVPEPQFIDFARTYLINFIFGAQLTQELNIYYWLVSIFIFLIFLVIGASYFRNAEESDSDKTENAIFVFFCAFIPNILTFTFSLISINVFFHTRYVIISLIPYLILLAIFINKINTKILKLLVILIVFAIGFNYSFIQNTMNGKMSLAQLLSKCNNHYTYYYYPKYFYKYVKQSEIDFKKLEYFEDAITDDFSKLGDKFFILINNTLGDSTPDRNEDLLILKAINKFSKETCIFKSINFDLFFYENTDKEKLRKWYAVYKNEKLDINPNIIYIGADNHLFDSSIYFYKLIASDSLKLGRWTSKENVNLKLPTPFPKGNFQLELNFYSKEKKINKLEISIPENKKEIFKVNVGENKIIYNFKINNMIDSLNVNISTDMWLEKERNLKCGILFYNIKIIPQKPKL